MRPPDPSAAKRDTPDHVETIRVRFSDSDSMGLAHHSNYFRWLEEARMGFLREGGWPYSEIEKRRIHMPVVECSCRFVSAVRSEDLIDVHLRISAVSRARIGFQYEISRADSGTLAASAATEHAYVDDDGRPTRLDSTSELWLWLSERRVE